MRVAPLSSSELKGDQLFKRFGLGFATGYVFGARAGEKRYREIVNLAEYVAQIPLVQRLAEDGRELATEQGRRLIGNFRERARGLDEAAPDLDGQHDAYDDEEGDYDEEEEEEDEIHAR